MYIVYDQRLDEEKKLTLPCLTSVESPVKISW